MALLVGFSEFSVWSLIAASIEWLGGVLEYSFCVGLDYNTGMALICSCLFIQKLEIQFSLSTIYYYIIASHLVTITLLLPRLLLLLLLLLQLLLLLLVHIHICMRMCARARARLCVEFWINDRLWYKKTPQSMITFDTRKRQSTIACNTRKYHKWWPVTKENTINDGLWH